MLWNCSIIVSAGLADHAGVAVMPEMLAAAGRARAMASAAPARRRKLWLDTYLLLTVIGPGPMNDSMGFMFQCTLSLRLWFFLCLSPILSPGALVTSPVLISFHSQDFRSVEGRVKRLGSGVTLRDAIIFPRPRIEACSRSSRPSLSSP